MHSNLLCVPVHMNIVTVYDNSCHFCYAVLIVTLPANDTITEGQPEEVLVLVSSTAYEFDFTVTLVNVDGSAFG